MYFVSLASGRNIRAQKGLRAQNMTCFQCCADSNILLASKRCVLWQRICHRDKLRVETNWWYVGKALGFRAKPHSHLHAVYCPPDCLVQTLWTFPWQLTATNIYFNHSTNQYMLTLINNTYFCFMILAVYSKLTW